MYSDVVGFDKERSICALFITEYNDLPLERQSGGADMADTFRNEKGPAMPALRRCSACALRERRLHHDLDLESGIGELGLDRGARRRVAGRHPGVPDLVHLAPGADVGQPEIGRQDLRL